MAEINILNKKESDASLWQFEVEIKENGDAVEYVVDLQEKYWAKLTDKKITPEDLVRRSLAFLLAREPKESILRHFNLTDITRYFPEYESEIVRNI